MGVARGEAVERKVYVFKKGCGHLVRPAYVVVQRGDELHVVNMTAGPIEVCMPDDAAFERPGRRVPARINPELNDWVIGVRGDAPPGVYPYAVYCSAGKDFAAGESNPMVIIDP
jgi:hypothetical protein